MFRSVYIFQIVLVHLIFGLFIPFVISVDYKLVQIQKGLNEIEISLCFCELLNKPKSVSKSFCCSLVRAILFLFLFL